MPELETTHGKRFVPALGLHALTALYDPLIRRWGAAAQVRRAVVASMELRPGMRILELGAGPGRLAIEVKTLHPEVHVEAIEYDPRMIALAKRNAESSQVSLDVREQDMTSLRSESDFDCIYSTMVFHHLLPTQKIAALVAARRALKPGGVFVVADFGKPRDLVQSVLFRFVQQPLDGFANTRPHRDGSYQDAVRERFSEVDSAQTWRTIAGTLELLVCRA